MGSLLQKYWWEELSEKLTIQCFLEWRPVDQRNRSSEFLQRGWPFFGPQFQHRSNLDGRHRCWTTLECSIWNSSVQRNMDPPQKPNETGICWKYKCDLLDTFRHPTQAKIRASESSQKQQKQRTRRTRNLPRRLQVIPNLKSYEESAALTEGEGMCGRSRISVLNIFPWRI